MNDCNEMVTVYYPAVAGSPVSLCLTFDTHTNLEALAPVFRFFRFFSVTVQVGDTKKNWRSRRLHLIVGFGNPKQ